MSIIDSRIVEMKFDNKQFLNGIKDTISGIENLTSKLKLLDAFEGIGNIANGIKNIDLGDMASNIEKVAERFTFMGIVSNEVLEKIASKVVGVTSKITGLVESLSLGQLSAGWQKYEEKTTAVQTIMAATADQFDNTETQMEYVNGQLEKLNWFTDETSYNFVDMVGNIGKFTSNGIKLESAVTSMQGIANWAAISGQNAATASRAMYNLAQAIGVGSVKLIDWRSIENANMATKEFKQSVLDTAVELGKLKKNADNTYSIVGSTSKNNLVSLQDFNSELSQGWFDKDVLQKVLDKYGSVTNQLYELSEASGASATDILQFVEAEKKGTLSTSAMAEVIEGSGMSVEEFRAQIKDLASEENEFGIKAFKAAQEAKTFHDAIDATKDAVSTGWMNTWELIFGDYETARHVWTDFANNLWDIFASGSERRNDILEEWGTSGFEKLTNKLKTAGVDIEFFDKKLNEALSREGVPIDDLIKEFGSLEEAIAANAIEADSLSHAIKAALGSVINNADEAGAALGKTEEALEKYQQLANDIIAGKYGNGDDRIKALTEAGYDPKELQHLADIAWNRKLTLDDLNDSMLANVGLTEEQIKMVRELQNDEELLNNIQSRSGREMFLNAVNNTLASIASIMDLIKETVGEVFGEIDAAGLTRFSEKLETITEAMNVWDDENKTWTKSGETIKTLLEAIFIPMKQRIDMIKELSGLLSGSGDAIKRMAEPLIDIVKLASDLLQVFQSGLLTAIRVFVNSVDSESIFSKFADSVQKVRDVLYDFYEAVDKFEIKDTAYKALTFVFDTLKDAIQYVTSWVKIFFSELTNGQSLVDWISGRLVFLKAIFASFSNLFPTIISLGKTLLSPFEAFFALLGELTSKIDILNTVYVVSEHLVNILGWLDTKIQNIQSVISNSNLGEFINSAAEKLPRLSEVAQKVFEIVEKGLGKISGFLSNLFSKLIGGQDPVEWINKNLEKLGPLFENIKTIFEPLGRIFEVFSNVFGKFTTSLAGAASHVNVIDILSKGFEILGKVLGIVADIIEGIYNKLNEWGIWDVVSSIGQGLSSLGKTIGNFISNVFTKKEGQQTAFEWIVDKISTAITKLKDILTNVGGAIGRAWDTITGGEGLAAIKLKDIPGMLLKLALSFKWVSKGLKAIQEGKAVTSVTNMFNKITDIIKKVKKGDFNLMEDLVGLKFGGGNELDGIVESIKNIAKAVLMFAGALLILSVLDYDKVADGVAMLSSIFGIAVLYLAALLKVSKDLGITAQSLLIGAAAIAVLAAACVLLTVALAGMVLVAKMASLQDLVEAIGALGSMLIIFGTVLTLMSRLCTFPSDFLYAAGAMLILAAAMNVLVIAIAAMTILANIPGFVEGLIALGAALVVIATVLTVVSKILGDNAPMVLAVAGAILLVSVALTILVAGIAALTLILSTSENAVMAFLVVVVALLATLVIVAVVLTALAGVGSGILVAAGAVAGFAAALLLLGVAAIVVDAALIGLAAAIIAVTLAIGVGLIAIVGGIVGAISLLVSGIGEIITTIVTVLSNIPKLIGEGIGAGITGIADGIASFNVSLGLLGEAMTQIAAGVDSLKTSLTDVSLIDIAKVAKGFSDLASAFKDLNKHAPSQELIIGFAQLAQGTLLVASIDFTAIGFNVGAGLAAGILKSEELANFSIVHLATSLIEKAKAILQINSPSLVFTQLGEFTSEGFANGILNGEDDVSNAGSTLLEGFGDMFATGLTDQISGLGGNLGDGFSGMFASATPGAEESASIFGEDILGSLSDTFGDGIGDIGSIIPSGLAEGIQNGVPDVEGASDGLLSGITGSFTDGSFDFTSIGSMIPEGIASGIRSNKGEVTEATSEVASDAQASASGLSSMLGGLFSNEDTTVKVSPVIDISAVEPALQELRDKVTSAMAIVRNTIASYITGIGSDVSTEYLKLKTAAVDEITNVMASAASIKESVTDLFTFIQKGISEAIVYVLEMADSFKFLNDNRISNATISAVNKYSVAVGNFVTIINMVHASITAFIPVITQLGASMIVNFASGISSRSSSASTAANNVAARAYNAANAWVDSFYWIGANAAIGLANGINDYAYKAINAANAMANKVTVRTGNVLQVASPSKVFMRIGEYMSEGMAIGITNKSAMVETASVDSTKSAIDSAYMLAEAINYAMEQNEGDIVITPVLDLSEIQNGAGSISSLLDSANSTIKLGADVSASMIRGTTNEPQSVIATLDAAAMQALNNSTNKKVDVDVSFTGSLAQLAALLHPYIKAEENRIGPSYIKG